MDEKRTIGANSSSYLLGLDKDYKPHGAYINDPKALFIFRWYKEVDASGRELSGYQNKECKGYKLMLDNDGAPFVYTSNLQVISKVYLKKLLAWARTFSLNRSDATMVKKKVAAK